jgi:hypothetical protein
MPEPVRCCIDKVGETPHDWPVTDDEVVAFWRANGEPFQTREEADLEIPCLKMDKPEKVVVPEA